MFINYRSIADLSQDIKNNLHKIPGDVSLVVGIPRSGMLVGNLLALYLNVPLTDFESFIKEEILISGFRGEKFTKEAFGGRILIVDDSINSGHALKEAKQKIKGIIDSEKYSISFCCIYVSPHQRKAVDIPLVLLESPRLFEWNIFHHLLIGNACVELDGILCETPGNTAGIAADDPMNFYRNARPRIIPKVKIKTIVTTRPEQYRQITEEWLKKNSIQFDELAMPATHPAASPTAGDLEAAFKANEFLKYKNNYLFLEYKQASALKIFELTGKSVYCVETNEMYSKQTYTALAKRKTHMILKGVTTKIRQIFGIVVP